MQGFIITDQFDRFLQQLIQHRLLSPTFPLTPLKLMSLSVYNGFQPMPIVYFLVEDYELQAGGRRVPLP